MDLKYSAYVLSRPFSTMTRVLKPSSLAPRQISRAEWLPIVAIVIRRAEPVILDLIENPDPRFREDDKTNEVELRILDINCLFPLGSYSDKTNWYTGELFDKFNIIFGVFGQVFKIANF